MKRILASTLTAGLPIAVIALLSGCGVQETKVNPNMLVTRPHLDARLAAEDFAFPSADPSLLNGKEVYKQNCVTCHAADYWQKPVVKDHLATVTPIDFYLMLTTGNGGTVQGDMVTDERQPLKVVNHPVYREKLTRDDRWDVLFYARHLSGMSDMAFKNDEGKTIDIASIYGANCAVCHGKTGHGNGPLATGHPSSHELSAGKVHGGLFEPPPANFNQYDRLYNRTDAQLMKYIRQGIYPSGMPPWLGFKDEENKFTFDEATIWQLVKHVRTFGYKSDLPDGEVIPQGQLPESLHQFKDPASMKPLAGVYQMIRSSKSMNRPPEDYMDPSH